MPKLIQKIPAMVFYLTLIALMPAGANEATNNKNLNKLIPVHSSETNASQRADADMSNSTQDLSIFAKPGNLLRSPKQPRNKRPFFKLTHIEPLKAVRSAALLDFNNDSQTDILLSSGGTVIILKNQGQGKFLNVLSYPDDNSTGLGAGDLNRDGILDIHITSKNIPDNLILYPKNNFDFLDLNNEGEGIVRTTLFDDFDGDGLLDSYHSTSSFNENHEWNQMRYGLPDGKFSDNVIDDLLNPPIPDFWHKTTDPLPEVGTMQWSNKQWKGAVIRDFDQDGRPDIIAAAYADLGYQDNRFKPYSLQWVENQTRGLFLFHNQSTPGMMTFQEIGREVFGSDMQGDTPSTWNPYQITPFDYDNDGDLDLFIGAKIRPQERIGEIEDTYAVKFFENQSQPGQVKFIDRTNETGFSKFNDLKPENRVSYCFAAGAAIDIDNNGWTDLVLINRVEKYNAAPYVHVFMNNGDGTFSQSSPEKHGLNWGSGGREITYDDFNQDGKLDLVIIDGKAGGTAGNDEARIYLNQIDNSNKWIMLNVRDDDDVFVTGAKVSVFKSGTTELIGYNEVRTDFSYRSKKTPVIHFGLAEIANVDVTVTLPSGLKKDFTNLKANNKHILQINKAPTVPLLLLPIGDKNVTEEQLLNFEISSEGGTPGATIKYTALNLPDGATLDGQVFQYRPSYGDRGEYQVIFMVSENLSNQSDQETVTITVTAAPKPKLTVTPINDNNEITASTVTFQWDEIPSATEYALGVATSADKLTTPPWGDIFADSTGTNTSQTVSGIPLTENPIYVRLWWNTNGLWKSEDYTYQTINQPAVSPEMLNPAPGSVINTSTATFEWTPTSGITEYYLSVATSADKLTKTPWGDIFADSTGTNTSQTVSGIPLTGKPIYVRLWWKIRKTWFSEDYTYQTYQFEVHDRAVLTPRECRDPEYLYPLNYVPCHSAVKEEAIYLRIFDPKTGFPTQIKYLIDGDAPFNDQGPEWGVSADQTRIVYRKYTSQTNVNTWQTENLLTAKLANIKVEPFSNCAGALCQLSNASKSRDKEFMIAYSSPGSGEYYQSSRNHKPTPFPYKKAGRKVGFLPGTNKLIYIADVGTKTLDKEIVLVDTDTGQSKIITNVNHNGFMMALGLYSPELNDNLIAAWDDRGNGKIHIYKHLGNNNFEVINTLESPSAEYPYLGTFAVLEHADFGGDVASWDKAYLVVAAGVEKTNSPDVFSSIWVMDVFGTFVRRVDEGAVNGSSKIRWDAEFYIGHDQEDKIDRLFVTYNETIRGQGMQLRVAKTGLEFPFHNSDGIVLHSDINYSKTPVFDDIRKLDVYTKEGLQNSPVMLGVHGGSWVKGDKVGWTHEKPEYFTDLGFVFVSINYRLSPDEKTAMEMKNAGTYGDRTRYPVHPQDLQEAAEWVFENIAQYGGDPTNISLIGHSAGGGIVSLAGSDPQFAPYTGTLEAMRYNCVISLDIGGAYDLTKSAPNSLMFQNAYATPEENKVEDTWRIASPVHIINDLPEEDLSLVASSFFLLTNDPSNQGGQLTRTFHSTLNEREIYSEYLEVDYEHEELNRLLGAPDETIMTPVVTNFLTSRCREK